MGQKIRLAGIGIFKVGFSSIGVNKKEDCTAATITSRRVLFQPEVERIVVGSAEKDGKIIQKYVNAKTLIKDVVFEETHDNSMNLESEDTEQGGSSTPSTPSTGSGTVNDPSTGSGADNGGSGGSGIIPTPTDPEDDQPA